MVDDNLTLWIHTINWIRCLSQAERSTTLNTSQSSSLHSRTSDIVPKVPDELSVYPESAVQSLNHRHLSNKGLQIHSKQLLKNVHFNTYLQTSNFSTSSLKAKESIPGSDYAAATFIKCGEEERKRIKITRCPVLPPCLKFVQPPGRKKTYDVDKIRCGRICMPCCPLARYPPLCFDIKPKSVCNRKPNPRPSYSECAKDCIKMRSVCDCCSIKPPPCRLLPEILDECK